MGKVPLAALPAVAITSYWIDTFEVTEAEFKRFMDQGGYEKPQYWKYEFRKDGRVLSWADAMKLFVDKTNRPGPATWIQGEYPKVEEDYPVTGVSWFEAEAYAEFAGKSLPTIYHWTAAACPTDSSSLIPAGNFGGKGPSPVGAYRGMSWCGAYDMAGNVKEWCSNAATAWANRWPGLSCGFFLPHFDPVGGSQSASCIATPDPSNHRAVIAPKIKPPTCARYATPPVCTCATSPA